MLAQGREGAHKKPAIVPQGHLTKTPPLAPQLVSLVDSAKVFSGLGEVPAAVEWMLTGKAIGKVVVAI